MRQSKVAVAMSGGVDSSVTAALLKEAGYEVIGVYMRLWDGELVGIRSVGDGSRSDTGLADARRVCQILDVPFCVADFTEQFREWVVNYFCQEYDQGRTPNPCVVCNRFIKFDLLLRLVESMGADYLATGHYARIVTSGQGYCLLKATRFSVDQSYFLYTLSQQNLSRLMFPLGKYGKAEVRRMAAQRGLPVAERPKSQDICFIPDGDYREFLRQHIIPRPGDIVDQEGRVLGQHQGVAFYTVGQRTGLRIATGRRLFVLAIDAAKNRLVVGSADGLLSSSVRVRDLSFVGEAIRGPVTITAKIRFRSPEVSARLKIAGDVADILFDQPQRAITPGQSVVFYRGDEVLGGGIIEAS